MLRRGSSPAITVMVLAVVCATLASGVPTTAAPPSDACALVTTAEVEQVVGKVKGVPRRDDEGGVPRCVFQFANDQNAFEVWIMPFDAIARRLPKAKNPMKVTGLGDDAMLERGAFGLPYVDLYIRKGTVTVKLALQQTAGDEAKVRTLGQKAAARF